MENFGCVVHAEQHYIFRSQVTDFEYEQRANTILHELAHMWFGDLVTMRWWDDLWLNESFAEWASHWCNTQRHPVHRRLDDVPVDPQELGLPAGPALLDPPGLLRDARRRGGRGQLRRHHVRQGRQRHQAAGRLRRRSTPFLTGLRAYFAAARVGQRHLRRPARRRWRRPPAGSCASSPPSGWRPPRSTRCGRRSTIAAGRHLRARSPCCRRRRPAYPTLRTHRIGIGPVRPARRRAASAAS